MHVCLQLLFPSQSSLLCVPSVTLLLGVCVCRYLCVSGCLCVCVCLGVCVSACDAIRVCLSVSVWRRVSECLCVEPVCRGVCRGVTLSRCVEV